MNKSLPVENAQTNIRVAQVDDIGQMVLLSKIKRLEYEKHHPMFWRYAQNAELNQATWFVSILNNSDVIALVCEINAQVEGFIIGKLISAPEVYNPGGLTLYIDDFCISDKSTWGSIGILLFSTIKEKARLKAAVQILVACGAHDTVKRDFLRGLDLNVTSEWYVGSINHS